MPGHRRIQRRKDQGENLESDTPQDAANCAANRAVPPPLCRTRHDPHRRAHACSQEHPPQRARHEVGHKAERRGVLTGTHRVAQQDAQRAIHIVAQKQRDGRPRQTNQPGNHPFAHRLGGQSARETICHAQPEPVTRAQNQRQPQGLPNGLCRVNQYRLVVNQRLLYQERHRAPNAAQHQTQQ